MISFTSEQRFIVTGASSGIGEAVAILLNQLGATVVGIGRNASRLEGMKARCAHPEFMHLEQKDLSEDIANLPSYVKELKNRYGKFTGLAYCAGVGGLLPAMMMDYEKALYFFNNDYFAPLMVTKGFIDRRNNVGKGASIVVISSIDSFTSARGQCLYSGAKAALAASLKSISKEVASAGVRINTIHPSMINTPLVQVCGASDLGITEEAMSDRYPFGWGEPIDVAHFVAFLLSDCAKFLSGQQYVVDSGGLR